MDSYFFSYLFYKSLKWPFLSFQRQILIKFLYALSGNTGTLPKYCYCITVGSIRTSSLVNYKSYFKCIEICWIFIISHTHALIDIRVSLEGKKGFPFWFLSVFATEFLKVLNLVFSEVKRSSESAHIAARSSLWQYYFCSILIWRKMCISVGTPCIILHAYVGVDIKRQKMA